MKPNNTYTRIREIAERAEVTKQECSVLAANPDPDEADRIYLLDKLREMAGLSIGQWRYRADVEGLQAEITGHSPRPLRDAQDILRALEPTNE